MTADPSDHRQGPAVTDPYKAALAHLAGALEATRPGREAISIVRNGPQTMLANGDTGETRVLCDRLTDEEIALAVQAWEADLKWREAHRLPDDLPPIPASPPPPVFDPLVASLMNLAAEVVAESEMGTLEQMDAIAKQRDELASRLSAVLAAARSVLVAGPHSDLAVEIEAIRTSLAAADGAR